MSFLAPASPAQRSRRQAAIANRHEHAPCSPAEAVERILSVVTRADRTTTAEGVSWYQAANEVAAELADAYNVTDRQAAGIIAALSPQTGWALNVQLAGDFLQAHSLRRTDQFSGHTTNAIVKCQRIAAGEDPYRVLGGRKVRSFYTNIADPYRPGAVTVDRHALAITLGRPLTSKDRQLERPGVYQQTAAAYRTAARQLGILPHETQAIAWCQWRRETGADRFDGLPQLDTDPLLKF